MTPQAFFLLTICLSILSSCCGLLCVIKPQGVIRFQQLFYSKINWRMEPIDEKKEIRNTRGMGLFLIVASLFALFFLIGP